MASDREQWIDDSVNRLDGWYAAETGSDGFDFEELARVELAVATDVGKHLRAMTDKEAEIMVTWSEDEDPEPVAKVRGNWPEVHRALELIYQ